MQNNLQPGTLDHLVKGVLLRHVRHDGYLEPPGRKVLVRRPQRGRLLLGPDRGDDIVAPGEELFEDVCWCLVSLAEGRSLEYESGNRRRSK